MCERRGSETHPELAAHQILNQDFIDERDLAVVGHQRGDLREGDRSFRNSDLPSEHCLGSRLGTPEFRKDAVPLHPQTRASSAHDL